MTEIPREVGLDKLLIKFSSSSRDYWTVRDATRGTLITGGIGSGKSSSVGKMMAKAFLKNGFGGLVLAAKPDERHAWEQYVSEVGREQDLVIIEEGGDYRFNPFQYETERKGKGAGQTHNLVNLFMNIYQMGRNINGEGIAKEGERFWDNALKRCVRRLIDLLKLSGENVSIGNMYALVITTLTNQELDMFNNIMEGENETKIFQQLERWGEVNYYIRCLFQATKRVTNEQDKQIARKLERDYHLVKNYFNREFANLHERTRTIIVESFLGIAEPFLNGLLYEYFANDTTVYPEWTFDGKIIIVDFPIKDYLEAGAYAQGIFKLLFQQAAERRQFGEWKKPIFLWVDESQLFLTPYDQVFQTTARSAGVATVFITQNISNYYVAVGGTNPTARVDSLLGNLATKIMLCNNDAVTNEWAARTIGQDFRGVGGISAGQYSNFSLNQQWHYQIAPREFTTLKTGGEVNGFEVEAVITVASKIWSNKKNFLKTSFDQKF
ncbi:MAG: hypothetical protein ACRBG0_26630 [Lewinella sp.]|uniref:hypothetical protein n=1 Tax=Lewinella sp. TaxID=2004506 RepID=UPI003D6BFC19